MIYRKAAEGRTSGKGGFIEIERRRSLRRSYCYLNYWFAMVRTQVSFDLFTVHSE